MIFLIYYQYQKNINKIFSLISLYHYQYIFVLIANLNIL